MVALFCSYLRVSTDRQGRSGLGIEAQRAAVLSYLNGGGRLVGEFVEVESGKHTANRPQLAAALAQCTLTGAILLVAKLDRLNCDAHFLLGLQEGMTLPIVLAPAWNGSAQAATAVPALDRSTRRAVVMP